MPPSILFAVGFSIKGEPGQRLICPLWCCREAFFRSFKRLAKRAGLPNATTKWIRRGSASEMERLASGAGPAHLGHSRGSGDAIFRQSYRVAKICDRDLPMPPPISG